MQLRALTAALAVASACAFQPAPAAARRRTARAAALRPDIQRAVDILLDGKSSSAAAPAPLASTIVGGGRIGDLLLKLGVAGDVAVGRSDAMTDLPAGPIYVCTRNDALGDVIERTPEGRRADLVFLQNGVLQDFLDDRGLGDVTQCLVYFAVSKMGEAPIDGITDVNPEGLTAGTGKWAAEFKARLASGGLTCAVLGTEAYRRSMLEKHIWICAFMLVGAAHGGITVGEVESAHTAELSELVEQLLVAASAKGGVTFESGAVERLRAYARSVAHFPTAVKEPEWRNGWFLDFSTAELAAGRPDPAPLHTELMGKVQ